MESERNDRPTRNLFKVIIYATIGGGLGLFGTLIGFEHPWHQPTMELQPTHIFIAALASLLCGILAAVDVRKFLLALLESTSNTSF
jgi:hypothetical protein